MRKRLGGQDGFTLIELLISAGLVSLVILGAFRLYYFTDHAFVATTVRSDVQMDMQLAMRYIADSLRTAHRVEFAKAVEPDKLKDGGHYLFSRDGVIVLQTEDGVRPITSHYQDAVRYAIMFEASTDEDDRPLDSTVKITLRSLTPGVPYELETHVQALNLRLEGISGESPSSMLYFTTTFSPDEIEQGERLRRRCLLAAVVFEPHDPALQALRDFRDKVLSKPDMGRKMIAVYYKYSPYLIHFFATHTWARTALKAAMRLVILSVQLMTNTAYPMFVAALILVCFTNRRKRCAWRS